MAESWTSVWPSEILELMICRIRANLRSPNYYVLVKSKWYDERN
jgi:hypothetical protein